MKSVAAASLALLILIGCGPKPLPSAAPAAPQPAAPAAVSESPAPDKAVSYEELVPLPQPVLVTSFGQSPDSMLAREMFSKFGLEFTFDSMADPALIAEHKSVVIVVGTSVKSLISIGIDPQK